MGLWRSRSGWVRGCSFEVISNRSAKACPVCAQFLFGPSPLNLRATHQGGSGDIAGPLAWGFH